MSHQKLLVGAQAALIEELNLSLEVQLKNKKIAVAVS